MVGSNQHLPSESCSHLGSGDSLGHMGVVGGLLESLRPLCASSESGCLAWSDTKLERNRVYTSSEWGELIVVDVFFGGGDFHDLAQGCQSSATSLNLIVKRLSSDLTGTSNEAYLGLKRHTAVMRVNSGTNGAIPIALYLQFSSLHLHS